MNYKDINGQKFGRLTVTGYAGSPDGYARWNCICDCGKSYVARGHTLRDGRTKSCGCLSKEVASKKSRRHGATVGGISPEYRSYVKMKERCLNPNHPHFSNYGGRGLTICERWLSGFEFFLADMGKKPTLRHTLDRIDNDGNYEPSNCRWATRKQQNRNTRVSRPVKCETGIEFKSCGEAAEVMGGHQSGIRAACNSGKPYRGMHWFWCADLIGVEVSQLNANVGQAA